MASVANGSEQARQAQDVRLVVDTIPALAWSDRSDGSADFFNQRWLDENELRYCIVANGWKEKEIEGGINAAVTRFSFSRTGKQMRGKYK